MEQPVLIAVKNDDIVRSSTRMSSRFLALHRRRDITDLEKHPLPTADVTHPPQLLLPLLLTPIFIQLFFVYHTQPLLRDAILGVLVASL
jgi:hypothetical protein